MQEQINDIVTLCKYVKDINTSKLCLAKISTSLVQLSSMIALNNTKSYTSDYFEIKTLQDDKGLLVTIDIHNKSAVVSIFIDNTKSNGGMKYEFTIPYEYNYVKELYDRLGQFIK